jgi:tetratricopeptide (TPR) repeat protein
MEDTMRIPVTLTLIAGLALGIAGCVKKVDEGKIPVTTSSEKARQEFLQGRGLAEKLQIANSLQYFDKAIALDSNFATAYLNRANASFAAKDFFDYLKMAVAHSDRCSEGERLAILAANAGANANTVSQKEYLDSLVRLYPNDERAHFMLGAYFFGQQEYTHAIDQYNKAIEIAPEYSPVYNILGYAYRQTDNTDEAEKAFKKYTELIPNDPNPYDSYAELLMKIGRFDESIANYRKALAIDPNFIASHIGIAMNYLYKGKPDSGSAELVKLYSMARNDGERRQAIFAQVVIDADGGKMDAALKELDRQYTIAEKANDRAAMSGDFGAKGNILLEMGKYGDALAAYEKSAQLIASSDLSQQIKANAQLFLHYNRARTAIGKNEMAKAKAEAQEFREGAEANRNANQIRFAHELAGIIAMTEKKYDTAVAEFLQSNQQNPYDLYRLALAYGAKGDAAKEKEFCRKAADFNGLPALNYAFIRIRAQKLLSTL